MTLHIDLATARKLIDDAVKERGSEHVYSNPHKDSNNVRFLHGTYSSDNGGGPNCLYIHKDVDGEITPGCGVGLALINGGVPKEWFDGVDENSSTVWDKFPELREAGLITYTEPGRKYMGYFQSAQDLQSTWGDSQKHAERTIKSQ